MKLLFILPILFFAGVSGLSAQSGMGQASARAQADLEEALKELSEVQSTIVEEKVPLSKDINRLESEVLELRSNLERKERASAKQAFNLDALQRELNSRKANNEYVVNLLTEFVDNFAVRLPISELGDYEEAIAGAQAAPGDVNLSEAEKLEQQLAIVNAALDRLEDSLGGRRYAGKALTPEGVVEQGNFVAVGPLIFFANESGTVAGISQRQQNAAEAVVVPIPRWDPAGIVNLARTGEGALPFDPTLGNALKIAATRETVGEHLAKGGEVAYAIVALGLIALAFALFKLVEISRFNAPSKRQLNSLLDKIDEGKKEEALAEAKAIPGLTGEMLQEGVKHADERRGLLEELMFEKILQARPVLERFLPFIAITAAAAPLMGLLGTVTGMIKTFNLITVFGTGDARNLSSGISEALITTELGLMVAIPALIFHGLLARLARRKLGQMEQVAIGFVNGVATQNECNVCPKGD